jgi:hypothetical protein
MINKVSFFIVLAVTGTLSFSCKKEYTDKYNIIPGDTVRVMGYNHIVSFSLQKPGSDSLLQAAFVNDSIMVYWPSYWPLPDSVAPQIIIADSASITPTKGTKVPLRTGTQYVVTAQSKATRTYTIKLMVNQPQPWITGRIGFPVLPGRSIAITGDFILPDTILTKLYLVPIHSTGEVKVPLTSISITGCNLIIPAIDTGMYTIKLVSGWRTAIVKNENNSAVPFTVYVKDPTLPNMTISWPGAMTLQRGATFTLTGTNIRAVHECSARADASSPYYPLEIVQVELNAITLKIPSDYPVGEYSSLRFRTPYTSSTLGIYSVNLAAGNRLTISQ